MDILCSDKTGTLTLNKLTVDKSIIEVGDCEANTKDKCFTRIVCSNLGFGFAGVC